LSASACTKRERGHVRAALPHTRQCGVCECLPTGPVVRLCAGRRGIHAVGFLRPLVRSWRWLEVGPRGCVARVVAGARLSPRCWGSSSPPCTPAPSSGFTELRVRVSASSRTSWLWHGSVQCPGAGWMLCLDVMYTLYGGAGGGRGSASPASAVLLVLLCGGRHVSVSTSSCAPPSQRTPGERGLPLSRSWRRAKRTVAAHTRGEGSPARSWRRAKRTVVFALRVQLLGCELVEFTHVVQVP
jgi:hypothetical protein